MMNMISKSNMIRGSLILGLFIISGLVLGLPAHAQESTDLWSAPVNLSNSGGTTNPNLVIDANGQIHVIWQDFYKGTVYTGYDGTQWSRPVALSFPFSPPISDLPPEEQISTGYQHAFVVDGTGLVHAFWTDVEHTLFHSLVSTQSFGDPGAWTAASQLAESAVDFDVLVDGQGKIHLAYVRIVESTEFPAGIYYRVTADRGLSWSVPTPLYESPYFRSLSNADANVDLAVSQDGDRIYVSWDNRVRKQIYFTQSTNGGLDWGENQLIDSPTEVNPGARPYNILTVYFGDYVLLFWQDGDPVSSCRQYFRVSADDGNTWSNPREMLDQISGCPQEPFFFEQNGLLFMMASVQRQVYLAAWGGDQWSNPQLQAELLAFDDLETFEPVYFDCRKPAQDPSGMLVLVGCDTGSSGDIWITTRGMGDASGWFPSPSAWTSHEQVTTSSTPITDPILLADSLGQIHAFWIQKNIPDASTATSGSPSAAAREWIFYSRKSDNQWTSATAVLQSPMGMTRQAAVAVDASDNLSVVWSGGEAGEIYYSRATGSQANIPAEWGEPTMLPSVRQSGSSPDIQVDEDGMVHVAYAIPLNENRGIYLTTSSDGGSTWIEPTQIFDAVHDGWEEVDKPHLTVSGNGIYNVIWSRHALPGSSTPQGLYASHSSDGGVTWTEPDLVSEQTITWSDLITADGGTIYRVWTESRSDGAIFLYQQSTDLGANWSLPDSILLTGTSYGTPAITWNQTGQLFLVQAASDGSQGITLRNWRWDGTQWRSEEGYELQDQSSIALEAASVTVSNQGRLSLIYSGMANGPLQMPATYFIDSSSRMVDVTSEISTTEPPSTPQPTATLELIPTFQPTPTTFVNPIDTSLDIPPSSNSLGNNSWFGLAYGAILAGLIAVVVFAVRIMRMRNK